MPKFLYQASIISGLVGGYYGLSKSFERTQRNIFTGISSATFSKMDMSYFNEFVSLISLGVAIKYHLEDKNPELFKKIKNYNLKNFFTGKKQPTNL